MMTAITTQTSAIVRQRLRELIPSETVASVRVMA